jgi:hypothetical protein
MELILVDDLGNEHNADWCEWLVLTKYERELADAQEGNFRVPCTPGFITVLKDLLVSLISKNNFKKYDSYFPWRDRVNKFNLLQAKFANSPRAFLLFNSISVSQYTPF